MIKLIYCKGDFMKNKNSILFAFKRVIAALMDVSIFLIATMFIVLLVGEPIVEHTTDIVKIREEYSSLAEEYQVRIWNEEMGMYVDNPNISEEVLKAFNENPRVKELEEMNTEIVMNEVLISLTISSALIYVLIPILMKSNHSLGKKAMNLKVVSSKKCELQKHQLAIRGVSFIVIELFFGLISYGIIPLISLAMIMFTKNNQSIHDYLSKTKVVRATAGKEDIVSEEDDEYYKMIAKENARDLTIGGRNNDK